MVTVTIIIIAVPAIVVTAIVAVGVNPAIIVVAVSTVIATATAAIVIKGRPPFSCCGYCYYYNFESCF